MSLSKNQRDAWKTFSKFNKQLTIILADGVGRNRRFKEKSMIVWRALIHVWRDFIHDKIR